MTPPATPDTNDTHRVELRTTQGAQRGQSLARCTCGWVEINVVRHLTETAMHAHLAQHAPAPPTPATKAKRMTAQTKPQPPTHGGRA